MSRQVPASLPGAVGTAGGRWVIVASVLASSMAFIDGTIVTVALPDIQGEFGAPASSVQWIVEAYALLVAALILVGGALGDRLGRRRVFVAGTAIFAISSAACGLAPDIRMLIAARAAQGVGGAMLIPGSLALLQACFSGERRARAIGTWAGFAGITSVVGPVLGGALVDGPGWRWVFLLNLPFAVAVVAIAVTRIPESRNPAGRGVDWAGSLLLASGLAGLVFALVESTRQGWSDPHVLAATAAGVVGLAAFVRWEARCDEPMLPLGLLRSRRFAGATIFTLAMYFALSGVLFFVPFLLIQAQGYTALQAGAATAPSAVLLFLCGRASGILTRRVGQRLPLVAGPLLVAAGMLLYARPGPSADASVYWTTYGPAAVVLGLGLALFVPAITVVALDVVEERHAGLASGANNAVARLGTVLAIALLGLLVHGAFEQRLAVHLDDGGVEPAVGAQLQRDVDDLAAIQPPTGVDLATERRADAAIDEAYIDAFRLAMLVCALLSVGAAALAATLLGPAAATAGASAAAVHGAEARSGSA